MNITHIIGTTDPINGVYITDLNNRPVMVETDSQHPGIRLAELNKQHWDRNKSEKLALSEGITLNDQHWAVILYLRNYYLAYGLPRFARTLAKALNHQFAVQGGGKYLRRLFAGGPVTQGSRFANLRTPANATDTSFGTSY